MYTESVTGPTNVTTPIRAGLSKAHGASLNLGDLGRKFTGSIGAKGTERNFGPAGGERSQTTARRCFVSSHKDIIRDAPSLAPCALWRARLATSSNRLQYEGAPDRSQYERVSRQ
jgi:hypothetical protein